MPRLRSHGLLVAIGVLLAGAAASWGQSPREAPASGLREGFDDNPLAAPRRSDRARGRTRAERGSPSLRYGNPPGSGAGGARTGFLSTNARRAARPAPGQPAAIAGTPAEAPRRAVARRRGPAAPTSTTAYVPRPGPVFEPAPQPGLGPSSITTPRPVTTPPVRRPVPPEEDPFAPIGVRAGSFILRPAIEVTEAYDSNADRVPAGRSSAITTIAPELLVRSDWSRHELAANLRGSYTDYESIPSLNRPFFDGRVLGRIDVTRDTRIDLEGRVLVSTDYPGSPDLTAGFARLPIYTGVGGTLGVAHRFNRLEIAAKGTIDRFSYEDTLLTDGTLIDNRDRNYDQYGAQLRASYELTPGLKPFVEALFDTRVRDVPVDRFGVQRDSHGTWGKVGTTFEFTRTLTGELAVGYLVRTYKDPNLPDLSGLTVDGSLIWAATGLTAVKLTAVSRGDETTLPGVSGAFRRDLGLQVDHAFRRWLIGTARIGYGLDIYEGSTREDKRYLASLSLTYKFTREWQLRGELRREWLRSNTPGLDYTANVALVDLRWQR